MSDPDIYSRMPAAFQVYDIPFPVAADLYDAFPRQERCVTVPSVDLEWWKKHRQKRSQHSIHARKVTVSHTRTHELK